MKYLTLIISMGLLTTGHLAEGQTKKGINKQITQTMDLQTEKQAIEKVLMTYEDALNTSDVNKVLQVYGEDGMFMPTTLPTATGTEELKESYTSIFKMIQLTVKFTIEEIIVSGDVAFVRTSSKGTVLIHANGETGSEANREFFLLQKKNGEWKITRYMFNKSSK